MCDSPINENTTLVNCNSVRIRSKQSTFLSFSSDLVLFNTVSKFLVPNAKSCCHHSCGVGGKGKPETSRSNCKLFCMLSIGYKLQESSTQRNKLRSSGKRLACCCM